MCGFERDIAGRLEMGWGFVLHHIKLYSLRVSMIYLLIPLLLLTTARLRKDLLWKCPELHLFWLQMCFSPFPTAILLLSDKWEDQVC